MPSVITAGRRSGVWPVLASIALLLTVFFVSMRGSPDGTGESADMATADAQLEKKLDCEAKYWRKRKKEEGDLSHNYYPLWYEEGLGNLSALAGRKMLDIGCGPRGSLEWASQAAARVCADPLAHEYQSLDGPSHHRMVYVQAGVEDMPFIAESFDYVMSVNNFDHVTDPHKGASEIVRVLAPGGRFLLIVLVHPDPTPCEPQTLSWGVTQLFTSRGLRLIRQKATTKEGKSKGTGAIFNAEIDPANNSEGMLLALFEKPSNASP